MSNRTVHMNIYYASIPEMQMFPSPFSWIDPPSLLQDCFRGVELARQSRYMLGPILHSGSRKVGLLGRRYLGKARDDVVAAFVWDVVQIASAEAGAHAVRHPTTNNEYMRASWLTWGLLTWWRSCFRKAC